MTTLGQQIKKIRMEKELSQPELAETIGIEQSYLSKLENDKSIPSNDILRKLLSGLNISLSQLMSPLDLSYVKSTLYQIPDIEQWGKNKTELQSRFTHHLLITSSVLIVLAVTLFYTGYSHLAFNTTQYEYKSVGIVKEDEPFDYFEKGSYLSTPKRQGEDLSDELRRRYNPQLLKTFHNRGSSFLVEVEEGKRNYVSLRESKTTRAENSALQIVGVFLFVIGVMGFVLERRFTKLSQNS